jgi:hypothetical protein
VFATRRVSKKFPKLKLSELHGKLYLRLAAVTTDSVISPVQAVFAAKPIAVCVVNPVAGAPFAGFRAIGAGQTDRLKITAVNFGRLLGYPHLCMIKVSVTVAVHPAGVYGLPAIRANRHGERLLCSICFVVSNGHLFSS